MSALQERIKKSKANNMKVVIIGYGEMFANLILGCKDAGVNIAGVFRHDRILYDNITLFFKDIIAPGKDKSFIDSYNLYDIKAPGVNSEKFRNELIKLNPDVILVGSWSEKFNPKTFNIPKIGTINCHPSLLPKYRGPNPYAQVIKNGETKTGVTFHLMDSGFDTGAILQQCEIDILPSDTGETLKARCAKTARTQAAQLLYNLENEIIIPINQNEEKATYQKQICEDDILIDFNKTSFEIDRQIRGLTPWVKCYIPHKNSFLTFKNYKIFDNNTLTHEPGIIVNKSKNSLQISCCDDKIIEFNNLKLFGPFSFLTPLYLSLSVKIKDKAF